MMDTQQECGVGQADVHLESSCWWLFAEIQPQSGEWWKRLDHPPTTNHQSPKCQSTITNQQWPFTTDQPEQGGEGEDSTKFSLSPFQWILRTTAISPSSIFYRLVYIVMPTMVVKLILLKKGFNDEALHFRLESLYSPRSFDSTTTALDPFWPFPRFVFFTFCLKIIDCFHTNACWLFAAE